MDSPFVCDMSALTPADRDRHRELAGRLRPAVAEFLELADGYAARFPSDAETLRLLAEFLTLERQCCPFFSLALEAEPDHGPTWFRVTGPEGVKPFIRAEFGIP